MINEIAEVKDYIAGKNICKYNLYHTCYLIAKYCKENGMSRLETRTNIFDWANKYGYTLKFEVNSIINIVYERDKTNLSSVEYVEIPTEYIDAINERFDNMKVKLLAIAMLSYSMLHKNEYGEFRISNDTICAWTKLSKPWVISRGMKELIDFEFIEKVDNSKQYFSSGKSITTSNTYKILLSLNGKKHVRVNNNIVDCANEIFN